MEIVIVVLLGFLLDCLIGDPQKIPHPVRFIGLLIEKGEKLIRSVFPKGKNGEFAGGILLNLIVLAVSFLVPFFLLKGFALVHPALRFAAEVFFCCQIFAAKSLKQESMKVYTYIRKQDLLSSRKYLSWIVGRDTENLDFRQITKAVVETVAENASDGVIAPMLFMLIGGAPLGFLYKGVNTLDSMVGYKNEKYIHFGKFSAVVDDIFNFVPARLTGLSMVIGAFFTGMNGPKAFRIFLRDRHNHASPNSANPESACAGALGVQLAGDAWYFGKLYKKKTIGDDDRPIEAEDIRRTIRLMYAASLLCLVVFSAVRVILVVVL